MRMVYPELFAKNNRIAKVFGKAFLEKYGHLINWKNHPSIMEIGHGDGGTSRSSLFPYLPSDLKEFVATDLSQSVIEYARNNAVLPLMKFEKLDITTKEVPLKYLGRFDHIFGIWVMHTVKDPRQGFLNMHKMLTPGGSIFLTFCERTTIDYAMDELLKHPKWSKYVDKSLISPYFYSSNPRHEWERLLNETGFNNYEFFEENRSFEFLDDNEFDNLLISHISFLPKIPQDKLKNFQTVYKALTRKGKLMSTQVRDGKEVISWNGKWFITCATKT